MTAPRITLEAWLAANFAGPGAPTIGAVRRWARTGKIQPPPVKCGRSYYVDPDARYTEPAERGSLLDKVQKAHAAQTTRSVTH